MCDSIEIVFGAAVSTNDLDLPLSFVAKEDQYGRTTDRKVSWEKARSPLTGATNEIQAQVREFIDTSSGECKKCVIGYKVSVNVPASTIGNNVVVQNRVLSASKIAYALLQNWLLEKRCDVDAHQVFPFDSAMIASVTLTYSFRCDSNDDASSNNDMLLHRGEVIHPHQVNNSGAFAVGGTRNKTTYFKHRNHFISSYIKSGRTKKSFAHFANVNVERNLYGVGQKLMRVEVRLTQAYLKSKGLNNPSAWQRSDDDENPNAMGHKIIRQYFRFDDDLRQRAPKANHLDALNDADKSILRWHLDGKDVRQHQNMCGRDNKYFSAVRLRILDRLRIDIAIPWAVQRTLSSRLSTVLAADNLYRPTADVKAHSFYGDNIRNALRQLRKMVTAKREQLLPKNQHAHCDNINEQSTHVADAVPVTQKQKRRVLNTAVTAKTVLLHQRQHNNGS